MTLKFLWALLVAVDAEHPLVTPDPEGQRYAVLGCALCLAVAAQINASLQAAHARLPSNNCLSAKQLCDTLSDACDRGFTGYVLCEAGGVTGRDQCENPKEDESIPHSERPYSWTDRLRNECRWYVQEAGAQQLYRHWRQMQRQPPQQIDCFLCRSSGWLRTCANMHRWEVPSLQTPPTHHFSVSRLRVDCSGLWDW